VKRLLPALLLLTPVALAGAIIALWAELELSRRDADHVRRGLRDALAREAALAHRYARLVIRERRADAELHASDAALTEANAAVADLKKRLARAETPPAPIKVGDCFRNIGVDTVPTGSVFEITTCVDGWAIGWGPGPDGSRTRMHASIVWWLDPTIWERVDGVAAMPREPSGGVAEDEPAPWVAGRLRATGAPISIRLRADGDYDMRPGNGCDDEIERVARGEVRDLVALPGGWAQIEGAVRP
jgi:hypothetical protein